MYRWIMQDCCCCCCGCWWWLLLKGKTRATRRAVLIITQTVPECKCGAQFSIESLLSSHKAEQEFGAVAFRLRIQSSRGDRPLTHTCMCVTACMLWKRAHCWQAQQLKYLLVLRTMFFRVCNASHSHSGVHIWRLVTWCESKRCQPTYKLYV